MLVVVSGPIASGKSALARAVAREFEARGCRAAAVDLDLVYEMLDPSGGQKNDRQKWAQTRRVSARLAGALLAEDFYVIVEGDFLWASERAELVGALASGIEPLFVTLRVSFEEALVRVRLDPTRGMTRDPTFLRQHYERTAAAVRGTPRTDLVLDTGAVGIMDAARTVADWTSGRKGTSALAN
jgi:predicted kinase